MSQESLDLVVRAIKAATKQPPDFETVNALYHPEHVFVPLEASALGGADATGAHGYRAWLERTGDVVEWEADLKGAIDVGPGKVIAVTANRFEGASSGVATEDRVWCVVTVTDGKITRTEAYLTPAKALEAALTEQPGKESDSSPSRGGSVGSGTSAENVESARRAIVDVEFFWALLDEHVVWDMRATLPPVDLPEVVTGRDAVVEASRRYWGTWDEYRLEADELIDAGKSVVLVLREHGRGKGSGIPFERSFAQVWTFHRGKIIRWEILPDKAVALEAAGLPD